MGGPGREARGRGGCSGGWAAACQAVRSSRVGASPSKVRVLPAGMSRRQGRGGDVCRECPETRPPLSWRGGCLTGAKDRRGRGSWEGGPEVAAGAQVGRWPSLGPQEGPERAVEMKRWAQKQRQAWVPGSDCVPRPRSHRAVTVRGAERVGWGAAWRTLPRAWRGAGLAPGTARQP